MFPEYGGPLLSRKLLWFFSTDLSGDLALKNAGNSWWIQWCPFLLRQSTKCPEKLRRFFGSKFGTSSGRRFCKFRALLFCNPSDLIKKAPPHSVCLLVAEKAPSGGYRATGEISRQQYRLLRCNGPLLLQFAGPAGEPISDGSPYHCGRKRYIINSETQHFYFSHRPPLFLGVDACRDPGEGQFWVGFSVGFWSVFGRVLVGFSHFDQKSTKNRPKVDPVQGVRSECSAYEGWWSVAEIKVSIGNIFYM